MSFGSLFIQYDSRVLSCVLGGLLGCDLRFALVRFSVVAACVAFSVLLLYLLVAAAADNTAFAPSHSASLYWLGCGAVYFVSLLFPP